MNRVSPETANRWLSRGVKLCIVTLVFPILILVFGYLLAVPCAIAGDLIVHLVGHARLVGKIVSVFVLLIACGTAVGACKWIWPYSDFW